jgi:hypothetical protein
MEIRDRRPSGHLPAPDDYETPLTRTSLVEANRRFRLTGVQAAAGNDLVEADRLVKRTIKERFNGRRKGYEDFPTVGDYLAYLNGLEDEV